MRVAIIGLGFVGLTTGVCFASRGIRVIGIDTDRNKLAELKRGNTPFYEPGLAERLVRVLKNRKLVLSSDISDATDSNIMMIAVGTPSREDGSADLSYVIKAAESVGRAIKTKGSFHVIAIKSTVPPGTALESILPVIEKVSGKHALQDFGVCSNPEFLKEGNAVADTFKPDKVVIGTIDGRTKKLMVSLYRRFYHSMKVPIVETNPQTAELIKYANNSFLATKISFINTIANICEHIPGTDIEQIAYAIGLDKRIGPLFLKAGLGYGGSCFPKDVAAMIALAEQHGYSPDLLRDTHKINQLQPNRAIELLKVFLPNLAGKTIAILGLAFKPNTTDMREAVSLKVIERLKREGAIVKVFDPMAMEEAKKLLASNILYSETIEECLANADGCIIVTEWPQFKKISPLLLNKHMKSSIIVDGRRITRPDVFIGNVDGYSAIGYGY